jgi:hypothetical protein
VTNRQTVPGHGQKVCGKPCSRCRPVLVAALIDA